MQKKISPSIIWVAFIVYMILLVKFVLLKTPRKFLSHLTHFGKGNVESGERNMILIPFQTTWSCLSGERTVWEAIVNVGGNLFGFVPMGIMLPLLFLKLNAATKVIAAVFIISLCFELTQFFTGVGYCDIDDLIQNTLGGAMGFWVHKKYLLKHYSTSTNAAHK